MHCHCPSSHCQTYMPLQLLHVVTGTQLITGDKHSISLHEIVLGPPLHLRLVVTHPHPGQRHLVNYAPIIWADDGAAVMFGLGPKLPDVPLPWEDPATRHCSCDEEGPDCQVRTRCYVMPCHLLAHQGTAASGLTGHCMPAQQTPRHGCCSCR